MQQLEPERQRRWGGNHDWDDGDDGVHDRDHGCGHDWRHNWIEHNGFDHRNNRSNDDHDRRAHGGDNQHDRERNDRLHHDRFDHRLHEWDGRNDRDHDRRG
jgi:hypothetical protein